jgi:type I restriction enzyme S subunit
MGHGHSIVHIHASSLAKIGISLPPLNVQEAIAEVLDDAEQEINALIAEQAAVEKQRDALAIELLTGRLRVRDAAKAVFAR